MSKRLLAAMCVAGFLAGALIACGYAQRANAETEAPPAPPQVEPDREKCDAWIAFMVDGVLLRGPGVMVNLPALMQISMVCLGRLPHLLERSPHPHAAKPVVPTVPPPVNGERIEL